MNIYNFLRRYFNERSVREPKDFKLWVECFRVQYLNAYIFHRARELSIGDNTAFARHRLELVSDVAFQNEVWRCFLQTVDKLDRESREYLSVHRQEKQGMCTHRTLSFFVRSCVIPPMRSIKRAFKIINHDIAEPIRQVKPVAL
jgi:hypothetical protein